MGGQVCGSQPRHHAGEHKAFVRICEALYESLLASLSERRSLPNTRSPSCEKPPLSLLAAEFTEVQVRSKCPGACAEEERQLNQWAGLQALPQWADNSGKAPGAHTKCPYPVLSESANHRGLKPAGARPPEEGLRLG